MPSDNSRKIPFSFTAFPNGLLDAVMPLLRDTEWRVLCVVVRRTIHFRPGARAGGSAWISRSQLLTATGRDSEAVSRAVDALVRRRLLCVRDEAGRPLESPQDRRAARGKQLMALHPLLLRSMNLGAPGEAEPTSTARKIEHGSRDAGTAKPNTIEEKATKNLLNSRSRSRLWKTANDVFAPASNRPSPLSEQLSFADWNQDALLSEFFALFQARHNYRFGHPASESSLSEAQAAQLRQRWGEEGAKKIEELLDYFFTLDWHWLVTHGHSPGAFASSFNLLRLTYAKRVRSHSPTLRAAERPPEPPPSS